MPALRFNRYFFLALLAMLTLFATLAWQSFHTPRPADTCQGAGDTRMLWDALSRQIVPAVRL